MGVSVVLAPCFSMKHVAMKHMTKPERCLSYAKIVVKKHT